MKRLISKKIFVLIISGVFLVIFLIVLSSNVGAIAPCKSSIEYITIGTDCNPNKQITPSDCENLCVGQLGYENGVIFEKEGCNCKCASVSGCKTCGIPTETPCSQLTLDKCENYTYGIFNCMIFSWIEPKTCINSPYGFCIKSPPLIEKITLSPDPFIKYASSDFVNYSEVFEKDNLNCTITAIDSDAKHDILSVNYTITITPNGKNYNGSICEEDTTEPHMCIREKIIINNIAACQNGKPCIIEIPIKDIYPEDNITCEAFAKDIAEDVSPTVLSNKIKMPSFDVYINKVDALNTVSNPSTESNRLIVGKKHVVRTYAGFTSNLISWLDKNVKIEMIQKEYQMPDIILIDESSGSIDDYTLKNYPDKEYLKNSPYREIFPGIRAYTLLKEIKEAKNSANFLGLKKITEPNTYTFTATINSDYKIKESDNLNNKVREKENDKNAYHTLVLAQKQLRDYKVAIFLLGHSDTLFEEWANYKNNRGGQRVKDAIKFAQENINMLTSTTPLKDIEIIEISPIAFEYNQDIASSENIISHWGPLIAYPQLYRNDLQRDILKWINNEGKKIGADLVIGVTVDKNIMLKTTGVTEGPRVILPKSNENAIILGFNPNAHNSPFVLSHEFGHLLANLPEEHGKEIGPSNNGMTPSSVGKTTSPDGWYFKQNSFGEYINVGPRINIWDKENTDNYLDEPFEKNERRHGTISEINSLIMGPRHINIMGLFSGSSSDYNWIDWNTYSQIYNKLIEKEIIGR